MVKLGKATTLAGYMSPANLLGQQHRRVVRQALLEVASPEQADRMLDRALEAGDLDDVPEQLTFFSGFLFGPLRDVLDQEIGEEPSTTVVEQLQAIVDAAVAEPDAHPAETPSSTEVIVMVVDEDVSTRSQLLHLLKKNGWSAVSAPDTTVALAMCVRYQPNAVVSGSSQSRQLAALLRVALGEAAPPFVLLGDDESAEVAAVVPKPVEEGALLEALRPLVGA